jgi:cell division protein ZapA (FtsZ GTPase activity inhibitor)
MTLPRLLLVVLTVLAATAPLAAQDIDDGLAALRTRTGLTDDDRATIQAWVRQRSTAIVGNDAASAAVAFAQLRDGFRGNREFLDAYVAAGINAAREAIASADLVGAARLVVLLNHFNDLRTLDVLVTALGDSRAAVRAAAATGLATLQPKLTGNPDTFRQAIDALRAAGRREQSAKTLELIYRALDYSSVQVAAERNAAALALLAILQERAQQATTGRLSAYGADYVGVQAVNRLLAVLEPAERNDYTAAVARLLHHAVRRYAGGDNQLCKVDDRTGSADNIALRNATELLIRECEQQLVALLKPADAPQVTESMQRAECTNVVIEMNRWADVLKGSIGLQLPNVESPPEGGD